MLWNATVLRLNILSENKNSVRTCRQEWRLRNSFLCKCTIEIGIGLDVIVLFYNFIFLFSSLLKVNCWIIFDRLFVPNALPMNCIVSWTFYYIYLICFHIFGRLKLVLCVLRALRMRANRRTKFTTKNSLVYLVVWSCFFLFSSVFLLHWIGIHNYCALYVCRIWLLRILYGLHVHLTVWSGNKRSLSLVCPQVLFDFAQIGNDWSHINFPFE